jgi:hypothetical protein
VGRRHIKIIIETEEVLVARIEAKPIVAWCPKCQTETRKVTPIHAALLCHVDQNTIREWIQGGQAHAVETPDRGLLICLASLDRHL